MPSRTIASPVRQSDGLLPWRDWTCGAAPKRTWHGVAVPRCLGRKVRDDEGVIARSPRRPLPEHRNEVPPRARLLVSSGAKKIEAAFLPLLFFIYLNCVTESAPYRKPPSKPRRSSASRKTEWPGRVSSRPFKKQIPYFAYERRRRTAISSAPTPQVSSAMVAGSGIGLPAKPKEKSPGWP